MYDVIGMDKSEDMHHLITMKMLEKCDGGNELRKTRCNSFKSIGFELTVGFHLLDAFTVSFEASSQ